MPLHSLARTLRLYIRSELLIGEIRLKTQMRKFSLTVLAALVGLMALVFLNIGAYQMLLAGWGPIWTPFILAGKRTEIEPGGGGNRQHGGPQRAWQLGQRKVSGADHLRHHPQPQAPQTQPMRPPRSMPGFHLTPFA